MHPRIALSALLLASLLTTAPGRALADLASAASLAGGAANTPGVAAAGSPVFYSVSATTDGEGGVLYVWEDSRPGDPTSVTDIYAGRVGRFGTIWWSGAAVPVCVAYGGQRAPSIVSDGTRGAFIAWISSGFAESVYVQHIDASGAALWGDQWGAGEQVLV